MRLLRVLSILYAVCLITLILLMVFARRQEVRAEWLAFISLRDGQFDIYMTNVYSGETQRVTDSPEDETNLAWSPNASHLLFTYNVNGDWRIESVQVRSKTVTEVLRGRDHIFKVAWSGHQIVFDEAPDDESPKIYMLETGTARPYAVTTGTSNDIHPAFTPDGILYASVRDDRSTFGLYTTGGDVIVENEYGYLNPSMSPDGKWVLASRYSRQHFEIVKINVETGQETVVNVPQTNPELPQWSPDGRWIAYVASQNGNFDIFITNGQEVRQITNHPLWDAAPAWMPVVDLAWHVGRLSGVVLLLVGLNMLSGPIGGLLRHSVV